MERGFNSKTALIAVGMLAIVIYGSLYPFRFHGDTSLLNALQILGATRYKLSRPGDLIANVLFYIPFAFFFARSLLRLRWSATVALATTAGIGLSISMEMLQVYIPGRNPAMSDVYADAIGAFVGAVAGCLSRGRTAQVRGYRDHFAILLVVSWLGSRLYPYVPVIDLHKYWDALKPLIFSPSMTVLDVYRHAAVWLTIALILDALVGVVRSRLAVLALFLIMIFARVLIAQIALSPAEIVGGIFALLTWTFVLSQQKNRLVIVSALFVVSIILQALEPFQFTSTPRPFGWIPFRSLMRGSIETAMVSFFEKVFNYGCLVWLLARGGFSWIAATASGAALVMALRLIQVYLPGRSAEITDVVILFVAACIMRLMRETREEETALEPPAARPSVVLPS